MDRFKARARSLRASQTSAEARLWQALRNRRLARWKFRRQHSIDRYVVDFVTLDGKLIVEVDGVTHAEPSELARDKARTNVLEACGFHIVRVSNSDVYDNLEGVLEMIEGTLRFWFDNDEKNHMDLLSGDFIIIKGNRPHKALMIGKVVETDTFSPPRQDWIDGSDNYLRK